MFEVVEELSEVFPTPVGMNREYYERCYGPLRVPHARGDEPAVEVVYGDREGCSPRPWG
ncbi:hypothetical protein SAMN05421754_101161 [Nitrosomonas sp. Nm58]|nr:hypothetical protein SAMN05421754_101161 [Nitrosomonas sp. Nm58]